jgi:hypothetical protein
MMTIFKAVWEQWKVIAHKIGNFQARLLLSLFYFFILGPFAMGLKLLSDPLQLRTHIQGWLNYSSSPRAPRATDDPLLQARRQF